jgi:hypothetical protein
MERRWERLSELNHFLTREIARRLGAKTVIRDSSEFKLEDGRVDRLLSLLKQAGATTYISGPSAKEYLASSLPLFAREGIEVVWKDYSGYVPYPQLSQPFTNEVSILDLIANVSWARIPEHIWGHRDQLRMSS